jgi:hypothetical protein
MSFAPISLKVGDSIAAYRIVHLNGAMQVALTSATTDGIIGVTTDVATNANQAVPVAVSGVALVYCNDTFTAGGLVTTNAAGQAVPATAGTAGVAVLGRMLETVSATGTIAKVLVQPSIIYEVP